MAEPIIPEGQGKASGESWAMIRRLFSILLLLLLAAAAQAQTTFSVTFTRAVQSTPFTGRILVFLGPESGPEPRFGPDWFRPKPFFAVDVRRLRPGQSVLVGGADTIAFPGPLAHLSGAFRAQAVLDKGREREVGNGAGNGYSAATSVVLGARKRISLVVDRTVAAPVFHETERTKEVTVISRLLSAFYRRPVAMHAAVVLPEGYDADPGRRYPIVYLIPGFGGRHYEAEQRVGGPTPPDVAARIMVVLDPDCPLGHSVFADSANNGPWGTALVTELIPQIERRFRAIGKPAARFVTGHSSGGWSSLWLQIAYPDTFGGVWSTSPDPVDFRDFQRIDLYRDASMFVDGHGARRPLARMGQTPVLWFKDFSDMERPLGHGGQLGSFEAVFSPRGNDGRPRRLWNRRTGRIDRTTARAWEKYDIRLVLERRWATLGPKLRGKLHLYTGSRDTFYLEGAVKRLQESLARRGSDAKIEIVPGKDHMTLRDRAMEERIQREMTAQWKAAALEGREGI